jgi:hypothetical protein
MIINTAATMAAFRSFGPELAAAAAIVVEGGGPTLFITV